MLRPPSHRLKFMELSRLLIARPRIWAHRDGWLRATTTPRGTTIPACKGLVHHEKGYENIWTQTKWENNATRNDINTINWISFVYALQCIYNWQGSTTTRTQNTRTNTHTHTLTHAAHIKCNKMRALQVSSNATGNCQGDDAGKGHTFVAKIYKSTSEYTHINSRQHTHMFIFMQFKVKHQTVPLLVNVTYAQYVHVPTGCHRMGQRGKSCRAGKLAGLVAVGRCSCVMASTLAIRFFNSNQKCRTRLALVRRQRRRFDTKQI